MTPLRNVRLSQGLTLATVALAVKCDVGNLSRIETGTQKPSPQLAEDICKFFKGKVTEMELIYPERYDVASAKEFEILNQIEDVTHG